MNTIKKNHPFRKIGTLLIMVTFSIMLFAYGNTYGQIDTQRVIPPPQPIQQNAGFDVIIKFNGELIYGLVKEVGPYYISYQRTDIPDGPIYTIPRNEVYVISYRNQVRDYLIPADNGLSAENLYRDRHINYKDKDLFKNGSALVGLGFLRSFSKVKDVKNYSSSGSFPAILFGYEVNYESNVHLGVQIGFGSHKFSTQQFSSYDSTQNNITLKENIFALYVYGRYYLSKSSSLLQPYIIAGVGITSSNILSNNTISFTNNNSQVILVKSGSRSTGIGVTARIGAEYFLSNQLQLFVDAGFGLSVINAGLSVSLK
ncbi:MAG: outer membrane beta-barrel protein [Ginsengibacter sp.]|jgi:hypothetical protein